MSAAAEVASISGWLLFDSGYDLRAQRMLLSSLAASGIAGGNLLSSTTLAFLSIQKLNLCDWEDALMLARLWFKAGRTFSCPSCQSISSHPHIAAHAGAGQLSESYRAMDTALNLFDQGPGDDHTPSVDWVTLGEIHGQWATSALLLNDLQTATEQMDLAKYHYGQDANRSLSLHLLRLAAGMASAGRLDESVAYADVALDVGDNVGSHRFDEVKGDLMASTRRFKKERVIIEFTDKHESLRLNRLPRSNWSLRASA